MGKFSDYNVQLKGLADGVHTLNFHLGKKFFADMENEDVRDADLNVVLTISVKGETYNLHFAVTGTVTTACDRCLDDLVLPIDTEYSIVVEYGDDYNDDSDNMITIPASDTYLNVSYMIYDTAVLAIPIKHVHPQGKCNKQMSALLRKHSGGKAAGLDPDLADELDAIDEEVEQETDPRWDALKGLDSDGE